MKILQVIHDFLPRHQAGSELYCYQLSKAIQKQGHEVVLFFTEINHAEPSYSLRRGEYEGLPFWEVVNNHAYQRFEETYLNPALERHFEDCLNEISPDAVHFHHLMSLSYGCVNLCKLRNIPVLFTLHDYWLSCPKGGQRYKGEGEVCEVSRFQSCSDCISRYSVPQGIPLRAMKKVISWFEPASPTNLIPVLLRGKKQVPDRRFIYKNSLCIEGDCRDALIAHPPCRIECRLTVPPNAELDFAVSMAPQTYDQPGDGVRFRIFCEGMLLYERILHPKNNAEDRGWKSERIPLAEWAGKKKFVFETQAYPNGNYDYCSAAWGDMRFTLTQAESYRPSVLSHTKRWGEKFLTLFQQRRLRRMIALRTEHTKELFDAVDLFIAPSKFLRETFIAYGIQPEKIVFSDYGIDRNPFHFNEKAPAQPLRFTYIGTLVEHKGVHILIEAFNQMPKEGVLLNLYGDLSEYSGYVHRIQAMISHPGIVLRGRAENKSIPDILQNTDVLIVPSVWYENSPITIHEAFLSGVPVLTSRFGGMQNLVQHEKNGLLFEKGNPNELLQCMQRCLKETRLLSLIKPDPRSVKTIEQDAEWFLSVYAALQKKIPIPPPPDA